MIFEPGWVEAIASVITALIILGTAVAAFAQLRHGRNANDIVVYLRLVDFMDSPSITEARLAMTRIADKVAADPQYAETLKDPTVFPEEFRSIGEMLRFLEHICTLVTRGGVAEQLVLTEYADTFVDMWEKLRPAIAMRRYAFGPYTGRTFEHLAMRAKRYIDSGQMDRDYAMLERDPRDRSIAPTPTGGPPNA
jgi:hypothetical protein